jgi:hypothetical protein
MPLIQPNMVCKVGVYQRLYGQRVLNVLHYQLETTSQPVDDLVAAQAIADRLAQLGANSVFLQNLHAVQSTDIVTERIRAQWVYPAPTVYMSAIVNSTGDIQTEAGTANVAASIEKRTRRFGRRGVGRVQVGGVPNNAYTAGVFNGLYMGDLELLATKLTAPFSVQQGGMILYPCLYHGVSGPAPFDILLACVPQNTVRDMRRRTVGLGE